MKKFVELSIHDYMDMHPHTTIEVLEEEKVKDFIDHMNQMYSGGTTSLSRIMNAKEALQYCKDTFAEIITRPSQDEIDRKIVQNLVDMYRECYPETIKRY